MKILLSFYPEYKIRQLSEHTATMWLSNEFDLFIDVNANPGTWSAQRKRGTLRTDLMLHGGRVPKDDVDKADALITRYQDALVSWVMEMEGNEEAMIKKDLEVLKWPKKSRSQAPAPADQEESPYIIKGLYQQETEEKAQDKVVGKSSENTDYSVNDTPVTDKLPAPDSEGNSNLISYVGSVRDEEPQRTQNIGVLPEGMKDIEVPKHHSEPCYVVSLPEEPNLEEIKEAPGEEEDKKPKTLEDIREILEKRQAQEPEVLPVWDEKDQTLEKEIQKIKEKNQEEAALDIKTQFANNIIKNIEEVKLQPGDNYGDKITVKTMEIIQSIGELIIWAQGLAPMLPVDLNNRLSEIEENLEVLQLLQDIQKRQNLRDLQQDKEENQGQAAKVPQEIYVNKNSKGYSWRITARAASMEEAVKSVLQANERLLNLKKWDGDHES
jgi:hypothetical protein